MGLFNIAWATGQAIGAGGGGVVAQLASDGRAVPTRLAALFATFAVLRSARGRLLLAA